MTANDLQRAALVLFAMREAGELNTLAATKAICFVIRNRVKAGWHDANWLACIEHAADDACNPPPDRPRILDLRDRGLQKLAQDIDGIFYGTAHDDLEIGFGDVSKKETRPALYWYWMNRPSTPFFEEKIKHRRVRTRLTPLVFYE